MDLNYIRPELLLLVPVSWIVAQWYKVLSDKTKWIPLFLGAFNIVMCTLWLIIVGELVNPLLMVFHAITQGILIAGFSVYGHQIYHQMTNGKTDDKPDNRE